LRRGTSGRELLLHTEIGVGTSSLRVTWSLICVNSAGIEEDLLARILQKCDAVENAIGIFGEGATEYSPSLQCPQ
jgi:hypothetical protein